jgi:multiple antibiotic resistance protein
MPMDLEQLARMTFLIVGALFPIVNPLGDAPIFLSLTEGFGGNARTMLSRKIAVNSFILLVASMLIGSHILGFFGISIPVVQVGGGLVLLSTGWVMLKHREEEPAAAEAPAAVSPAELSQQAFYPLTLPLTVGPGSISVAITLGANRHVENIRSWPVLVSILVGSAILALSVYFAYRYADNVARALGQTAMNVIVKLSSFILLCIGVQIAWNGVAALLKSIR